MFIVVMTFSGCTSYVETSDADGRVLGVCKDGANLIGLPTSAAGAGECIGSANPKEQSDGIAPSRRPPAREAIVPVAVPETIPKHEPEWGDQSIIH